MEKHVKRAAILGVGHPRFRDAVRRYRDTQTRGVLGDPDPRRPAPEAVPARRR